MWSRKTDVCRSCDLYLQAATVRGRSYVKLRLVDETVATIESAISARLVDDEWFVINQLGVGIRC
jgi:hypothetical protein